MAMTGITPLHTPVWRQDGPDWIMMVGTRTVAALVPNSCDLFPRYRWLSRFVGGNEYPDYGWENVDFETLGIAQYDLEQWWFHMLRGERYHPREREDDA
jgi:hypothetical protein